MQHKIILARELQIEHLGKPISFVNNLGQAQNHILTGFLIRHLETHMSDDDDLTRVSIYCAMFSMNIKGNDTIWVFS